MYSSDNPSNERETTEESQLILNLGRIQADRFNRLKHHVDVLLGVMRDCKSKGNSDIQSSCMSLEASLRRHALEIEHRLSKLSIQGCSKQSIMPSTSDTKDGSCSEAKTETPSCKTNVPEVTINQKGCTSNGGKKSSNDDIKTLLSIHLDDQKLCLVYETKSSVNRKGTSKLKKNSLVQLQHTLDLILKGVNDIRMTKPIGFRTYLYMLPEKLVQ